MPPYIANLNQAEEDKNQKSSSDLKGSSENHPDYTMAMVRKKKKPRCFDCKNCNHQPVMDLEKKVGPFKQVKKGSKKKKIYMIESCNSSTFNIS
jgi:hypothetical protein